MSSTRVRFRPEVGPPYSVTAMRRPSGETTTCVENVPLVQVSMSRRSVRPGPRDGDQRHTVSLPGTTSVDQNAASGASAIASAEAEGTVVGAGEAEAADGGGVAEGDWLGADGDGERRG